MNRSEPQTAFMVPVKDLKCGDSVLQFFLLKSKDIRKTRSGLDYVDLSLSDSTGTILGKMWSEAIRRWGIDFVSGDCVKIEGRVEKYKEQHQIIIEKIRKADSSEVPDPSTLERTAACDPDAVFEELLCIADGLKPDNMAVFLRRLLVEFEQPLKTYPAARVVHHAYKGGLIEHVCSVVKRVGNMLELDTGINKNTALAGAMLHDFGKLTEMQQEFGSRTLQGRLIGHIVLGANLLTEFAVKMGMENEPWLAELQHIILSHHGELEFGAPIKPLTREAMLVHFMDNLDAKLKILDEALESADPEGFGSYNKWLAGKPYIGSAFFQEICDE